VIEALRAWGADNGRAPVSADWQRSGENHPALRSILDGPDPPFRSWSEALLAAGFIPRKRRGPEWTEAKLKRKAQSKERIARRRANKEEALKRAVAKENNNAVRVEKGT